MKSRELVIVLAAAFGLIAFNVTTNRFMTLPEQIGVIGFGCAAWWLGVCLGVLLTKPLKPYEYYELQYQLKKLMRHTRVHENIFKVHDQGEWVLFEDIEKLLEKRQ